jgi:hypothetical protein
MVDRGILKWNGSSFKFHFVVTGAPDCCCTYTHTHTREVAPERRKSVKQLTDTFCKRPCLQLGYISTYITHLYRFLFENNNGVHTFTWWHSGTNKRKQHEIPSKKEEKKVLVHRSRRCFYFFLNRFSFPPYSPTTTAELSDFKGVGWQKETYTQ